MIGLQILLVLVLLYAVAWYLASDIRLLGDNGWVLYYSPECIHCELQLQDIGWSSYFLTKVDCLANPEIRDKEEIKVFPTWKNSITGKIHEGKIPIADLFITLASAK